MSLIEDLFKGAIVISFIGLLDYGFCIKDMAKKAVQAHKKGLSSYGGYSRMLTETKKSWVK